jgi:hypothetical protein
MEIKGTKISISYHETPEEHKRLAKKYEHLNHKIKATPKDTRSSQTVLQSVEGFLDWTEGSGYWKEGTAIQTLLDMGILQTPFYTFTIIK